MSLRVAKHLLMAPSRGMQVAATAASTCGGFPCSICGLRLTNPRELGTHILTEHCDDKTTKRAAAAATPNKSKRAKKLKGTPSFGKRAVNGSPTWSTVCVEGAPTGMATPIPDALKAIQAPLPALVRSRRSSASVAKVQQHQQRNRRRGMIISASGGAAASTVRLHRAPTDVELRQKFIIDRDASMSASSSDANTTGSKYTCLLCAKVYSSR